jgi:hypothetical protein
MSTVTRDPARICPDVDRVVWRDLDGDVILFDLETGRSVVLSGSASVLWRGLSADDGLPGHGLTVTDLSELLVSTYAIDHDLAMADTESFIGDLHERGYVRSSDD